MDSRFNINISDVAKMSPLQEEILRNFQSFQPFWLPQIPCLPNGGSLQQPHPSLVG